MTRSQGTLATAAGFSVCLLTVFAVAPRFMGLGTESAETPHLDTFVEEESRDDDRGLDRAACIETV